MADDVGELLTCDIWHRPILRIVPDGIEIKCKFCNGTIHTLNRQEIEQLWDRMNNIHTTLVTTDKEMRV